MQTFSEAHAHGAFEWIGAYPRSRTTPDCFVRGDVIRHRAVRRGVFACQGHLAHATGETIAHQGALAHAGFGMAPAFCIVETAQIVFRHLAPRLVAGSLGLLPCCMSNHTRRRR